MFYTQVVQSNFFGMIFHSYIERNSFYNQKNKAMSVNLLEAIQQNLNYPPLHKIDPNAQKAADENISTEDKFSQAAIPAVLIGLYIYAQADEGATEILQGNNTQNLTDIIFGDEKSRALQAVSAYCNQPVAAVATQMNVIAKEGIKVVKENLTEKADIKELKLFLSNQKNNILLYLPASLNMGGLLHDNTLDDNTNKMEGPVSSLMQSIGSAFSTPVVAEEIKNK